jgi:hypothetical protein
LVNSKKNEPEKARAVVRPLQEFPLIARNSLKTSEAKFDE